MEQNIDIRKEMINKRKSMAYDDFVNKSSTICDMLINNKYYKDSKIIYVYCSINNEVDLSRLIVDAYSKGKVIAYPKVENNDINFYISKQEDSLKPGFMKIPEPENIHHAPTADMVIVPGTVFTKDGKRLGYGGGFYDRFLSRNRVYSVGVCYDFQLVDDLELNSHDQILNKVLWA